MYNQTYRFKPLWIWIFIIQKKIDVGLLASPTAFYVSLSDYEFKILASKETDKRCIKYDMLNYTSSNFFIAFGQTDCE